MRINESAGVITTKAKPHLKCMIDLSHRISTTRLEREHVNLMARMAEKGIDMAGIPPVQVRKGKTLAHKRIKRGYSVTVPKEGANRNQVRREIHKAEARSVLEAMARQRPGTFLELSHHFDESFRTTNRLILNWMKHTRTRNKFTKGLILCWWGHVAQLSYALPRQEAESMGLADLATRKIWEEEAASVYAAMQQKGKHRFWKDQDREAYRAAAYLKKAEEACRNAFPLSPSRALARKRVKRGRARLLAVDEMRRKAVMVQQVFY